MGTVFLLHLSRTMGKTASDYISEHKVMVFSKSYCPYCISLKNTLSKMKIDYTAIELDKTSGGSKIQSQAKAISGVGSFPQLFIDGKFFGTCDSTHAKIRSGDLQKTLKDAGIS